VKRSVAIIGAGTRGLRWAQVFAHARCDICVFDPDPDTRQAVSKLSETHPSVVISDALSHAVAGAQWIQECVPERIALKQKIFQVIQANCDAEAILASSSDSLSVDDLQNCAMRPEQIVVAQPADLTSNIPSVRLLWNDRTPKTVQTSARRFLTGIGCVLQP